MRALISGATSYLGHRLAAALIGRGDKVDVLLRKRSNPERLRALPVPPTEHLSSPGEAVAAARPDLIFHLVAPSSDVRAEDVESFLSFSLQLMDSAAATRKARFINIGTWWQFSENSLYRPVNLYAAAKQAVHDLLVHYATRGLPACTAVPYDVYGPGDWRGRFLSRLCAAFDQPLDATEGFQVVDLVHVVDVVSGLLAASEAPTDPEGCPVYTLGSGRRLTLRELADMVAAIAGRPPRVRWGVVPYGPGQPLRPCPADRPPPGWTATIPLERGIREVLAHG